jgi:hypothetical protein
VTQPAETVRIAAECPEAWLARRAAAGRPAESWVPVPAWYYQHIGLPVPAVPHQVSDQGRIRNAAGHVLSQRPNGRPKELPPQEQYRLANLCAGGRKVTVPVHHVVLAGFAAEDRDGRDTRHLGRGRACRAWNWWPEGVCYGTRAENEADKDPQARIAAAAKANAVQAAARAAKAQVPARRGLLRRVRALGRFFRIGVR